MIKIAPDKWKHFFVGIAMGIVFLLAGYWLMGAHPYIAGTVSFVLIVTISYGFELFSRFTGIGHYEVMDAVAAIIGGLLGMGIAWAIVHCTGCWRI